MKITIPGINIQFPISRSILSGEKTIETRTYPIPNHYLNKELLFIETPGPEGKFKASAVGIIRFDSCFKYETQEIFYSDEKRHKVSKESPFAWKQEPKWGWEIGYLQPFKEAYPINQIRGIVFTKSLTVTVETARTVDI
jgi:hypothetical protein